MTTEMPENTEVQIGVPPELPVTQYANSTFIFGGVNESDLTVIFLRTPLLTQELVDAFRASGSKTLIGTAVGGITLPYTVAKSMATRLLAIIEDVERITGK